MTDAQKYRELVRLIENYTREHTVSADSARKALIQEGIYDGRGRLRKKFREEGYKPKVTA